MKYALAASTGLFVFYILRMFLELRGSKEQRLIRKRLSAVKRMKRHDGGTEEEHRGYRINLDWIKLPSWLQRDLKTAGISADPREFAAV